MEKQLLKKSGILAIATTFILLAFWLGFSKISLGIDNNTLTSYDMKKDSTVYERLIIICGTSGSGIVFGSTTGVWVGTPTDSTLARIFFNTATGQLEFKPSGTTTSYPFGSVTVAYLDANYATIAALSSYLLSTGGAGTGNVFNTPTLNSAQLAGSTTIGTASTITADGTIYSATKLKWLASATEDLQAAINSNESQINAHAGSTTGTHGVGADYIAKTSNSSQVMGHSELSGVTANDHHNQVHGAADHSGNVGTESQITFGTASGHSHNGSDSTKIDYDTAPVELGTDTVGNSDNVSEGSTNKYYTDARVNAAIGSSTLSNLSDVGTATEGQFLKRVGETWIGAANSVTTYWSDILGDPANGTTASSYISDTIGINKIPFTGTSTNLNSWIDNTVIEIPATSTAILGTSTKGRVQLVTINPGKVAAVSAPINTATTVLGLHLDGTDGSTTFTDFSSNNFTVTGSNSAHLNTEKKFLGDSSCRFVGTASSCLSSADSGTWTIGANAYTRRFWVLFNSLSGDDTFYEQYQNATNYFRFALVSGNSLQVYGRDGGSSYANTSISWTPATGTPYYLEVSRDASTTTARIFIDGFKQNVTHGSIDGFTIPNYVANVTIGCRTDGTNAFDGWIDEYEALSDAGHTSDYVVFKPVPSHRLTYTPPGYSNPIMVIQTPGTMSTQRSLVMFNGSLTAHGYGSETDITAGDTYSTESLKAELATNFTVKSKDKKGRNFKRFTGNYLDIVCGINLWSWNPVNNIDFYRLDAEAMAKEAFIRQNKEDWKSLHGNEYISEITEIGTGTITIIDEVSLETDYKNYIELEWASLQTQSEWISTVENNAECDTTLRRTGFRYEDTTTPSELKEPEGVGLLNATAMAFKAIQELRAIVGSLTVEIETLKRK